MSEEMVSNGDKRNADGTFAVGYEGGPGRPVETPEQKIVKRAIKELVKEYKEDLAQVLPQIKPVIVELARQGDMTAIKEIHDRVMDKSKQPTELSGELTTKAELTDEQLNRIIGQRAKELNSPENG